MEPVITHGVGGWELADLDWNPENGVATLSYVRPLAAGKEDDGLPREHVTRARQPHAPHHEGWSERR